LFHLLDPDNKRPEENCENNHHSHDNQWRVEKTPRQPIMVEYRAVTMAAIVPNNAAISNDDKFHQSRFCDYRFACISGSHSLPCETGIPRIGFKSDEGQHALLLVGIEGIVA
jgi:hypothetical protein